jgi:hypothetical protein
MSYLCSHIFSPHVALNHPFTVVGVVFAALIASQNTTRLFQLVVQLVDSTLKWFDVCPTDRSIPSQDGVTIANA